MVPPHFVGKYPIHECPESYQIGRTRWMLFLFRQCHVISGNGFGGATISRVEWPHGEKLGEEYLTVIQSFDIIRSELSVLLAEESDRQRKDNPTGNRP